MVVLGIFAAALAAYELVAVRIERTGISRPMVFVAVGAIVAAVGVIDPIEGEGPAGAAAAARRDRPDAGPVLRRLPDQPRLVARGLRPADAPARTGAADVDRPRHSGRPLAVRRARRLGVLPARGDPRADRRGARGRGRRGQARPGEDPALAQRRGGAQRRPRGAVRPALRRRRDGRARGSSRARSGSPPWSRRSGSASPPESPSVCSPASSPAAAAGPAGRAAPPSSSRWPASRSRCSSSPRRSAAAGSSPPSSAG